MGVGVSETGNQNETSSHKNNNNKHPDQAKGTGDADHVQNTTNTSEGRLTGLLNSSNKTHERKLRGELEEGGGWRRGCKHI